MSLAAVTQPPDPLTAATTAEDPAVSVSIRAVTKRFAGVQALDTIGLEIGRGEFFSLLGPSGCGKTTLLRIIGGFETPSSGEIWIGGRDVVRDPPYRRRTNMVFQHGALFPHLTVAQNIAFGLEMKRQDKATIRRRVDAALELVRLSGFGSRTVDQLSGGQRQRVALARAMINDPEVLLLDEPFSALDLQLRLQMQEELRRLHQQTGGTFIFVTHDQGEAITLSDRLAVMHSGAVLQVGTPREVYEAPACRSVAEFMGHSNFLPGVATDTPGVVQVVGGHPISCRPPDGIVPGAQVLVGLRYEKVEIAHAQGRTSGLTGTLIEEIYMGATVRRRVNLGSGLELIADAGNTGGGTVLRPGDPVAVSWPMDSVWVFAD